MILIADSGSTKVSWRLIYETGEVKPIYTNGINPLFVSEDYIKKILLKYFIPQIGTRIKQIYFYSAGIVSKESTEILSTIFNDVFPNASTYFASDMLGAARGMCGNVSGIVAILGTGSNSCMYNGEEIIGAIKAGGYILGDEASGAVLGKKLLGDYIKGIMPSELITEMLNRYNLDYAKIVDKVYRQPMPNMFLASFSPFIYEFRDNLYIENLLRSSFNEFLVRNIIRYDFANNKIYFVGSVAYYFQNLLIDEAAKLNITIEKIDQSPIDGLVQYHQLKNIIK